MKYYYVFCISSHSFHSMTPVYSVSGCKEIGRTYINFYFSSETIFEQT